MRYINLHFAYLLTYLLNTTTTTTTALYYALCSWRDTVILC